MHLCFVPENESTPRQQLLEHFLRLLQRSVDIMHVAPSLFCLILSALITFLSLKSKHRHIKDIQSEKKEKFALCTQYSEHCLSQKNVSDGIYAVLSLCWSFVSLQERPSWVFCLPCDGCHRTRLLHDHQTPHGLQHHEGQNCHERIQNSHRV